MKQDLAVFQLLYDIGVRKAQSILDFGCGYGAYTIPIAAMTGEYGKVYALDREREALDVLMRKAFQSGLKNVVRMETNGETVLGFPDESIDVVIMFDVLHSFYFPKPENRKTILGEIHRILKPSATLCISIWPNLRDPDIEGEIADACFSLIKEVPEKLTYATTFSEKRIIQSYRKVPCAPVAVALTNEAGRNYHE